MTSGVIRFYDVVISLHVMAVILAFGPTFGYAFFQTVTERLYPRGVPTMFRAMLMVDRFLVTPMMVVILAAGIYLVLDGPFDWEDTFVSVGIVGLIVLFAMTHAVLGRSEKKLMGLAERDIAAAGSGEVELSDEYWAASRRSAVYGTVAGLLVLAIVFMMIVKP